MNTSRIIKTPVQKIPIGEPIRMSTGQYGLRIKKPHADAVEDVPIDDILAMVIKGTDLQQ